MGIEAAGIQEQLLEKWMIFWWGLGIGLIAMTLASRLGLFKPIHAGPFPHIRGRDLMTGFGFFLFAEILLVPSLVGLALMSTGQTLNNIPAEAKGWINFSMVSAGFAAAAMTYFTLPFLERRRLWGTEKTPWYAHVLIGVGAWWASYPLILAFGEGLSLLLWYLYPHPFQEQTAVQNFRHALSGPVLFWLTVFAIAFLAPILEEFLFRGLLQSWLKQKTGNTTAAIVLASFVFALFHYSSAQGIGNIDLLATLFLLSILLGYIYERQCSLWAPIGLHSFFNLISLLMITLQNNSE